MGFEKLSLQAIDADIAVYLPKWQPEELDKVDLLLTLSIAFGETNQGINYFYVRVVTPKALLEKSTFLLTSRSTLLISYYDYKQLENELKNIIARCNKGNYQHSCDALSQYFDWEYNNYP